MYSMRATVSLTHIDGYLLEPHRTHPRGELRGQVLTYVRNTKRGVVMVASLRDPNDHVSAALLELLDVRLFSIFPHGIHLRGFEALGAAKAKRYVIQGWVISV